MFETSYGEDDYLIDLDLSFIGNDYTAHITADSVNVKDIKMEKSYHDDYDNDLALALEQCGTKKEIDLICKLWVEDSFG